MASLRLPTPMAFQIGVLMAVALAPIVAGHGTVAFPAMRENPSQRSLYCPWCQGSQFQCDPTTSHKCSPPTPCWGDKPGTLIEKKYFGKWKDLVMSDGKPWIAEGEGSIPVWCPGDVIPVHTYINADHNGVYRWESQLASPGKETEEAFTNFTSWKSVNQDPEADFYASNGITKLTPGKCYKPGKCDKWSPSCPHCRNNVFSNTSLTIPSNMPAGKTVLRWIWYGAMTVAGARVHGPEHSLFVNCKDIIVGSPEQCRQSRNKLYTLV